MGICHLFFAGSILLFAKTKASQMQFIMQVLKDFEHASVLCVSMEKLKAMVSRFVSQAKKEKLATMSSILFFQ